MKLYYDTLVAYMPDSTTNDKGEVVPDNKLAARRKAMIELASFQNTNNPIPLYQSIIDVCTYCGVDLVDTLLSIPDEIEFEEGTSIGQLLDEAAEMLFRSIKTNSNEEFDIYQYVARISAIIHVVINTQNSTNAESDPIEA